MSDPNPPAPSPAAAPFKPIDPNEGWAGVMGLEFIKISQEEVVVEWTVDHRHLQPHGIVHGGVHSGVIETVCSVGAAAHAMPRGQIVVGVENHTSFLRAVRDGRLRAVAKPLHVGQRAQLWEAHVTDERDRLVATGRVRLFCLDAEPSSGSRGSGSGTEGRSGA